MTGHDDRSGRSGRRRRFGLWSRAERLRLDDELSVDLSLDFSEYVEGIRTALAGFMVDAAKAGMDAPVPTTPEWNVRQLVAHQGMVHRWAVANLRGETPDVAAFEAEGLESSDPVAWLHEGGLHLIDTLQAAPEDLEALVFLNHAPAPRQFWARRQCHETTIHAVDAQAAALARMPRAEDTEITREVALDGIDELLHGFHTREKSRLRSARPLTIAIRATDLARSWSVRVGTGPAVVGPGSHREQADAVLEAPVEVLYLALWNRTDQLAGEGVEVWRSLAGVTWT
jgi:uncharacterized protein (TIGR03083 family)